MITEEDERRYGLRLLPDPPFPGIGEARRRNDVYAIHRRAYRVLHPDIEASDDPADASTHIAKDPPAETGGS